MNYDAPRRAKFEYPVGYTHNPRVSFYRPCWAEEPVMEPRCRAVEAQMERLSVEVALLRDVIVKLVEMRG